MFEIYKFGGSSVNNIESIENIIKKLKQLKNDIVIISAFRGVTDLLVDAYNPINYYDPNATDYDSDDSNDSNYIKEFGPESDHDLVSLLTIIDKLKVIHSDVINYYFRNDNKVILEINNQIEKISKEYLTKPKEYRMCLGEHLALVVLSYVFNKNNLEFTKVLSKDILLQKNNEIDYELSRENFNKLNFKDNFLLTTGFVVFDLDLNMVTNLGRGGSDYTATIFSQIFENCKKIYLCSDVDGIFGIDPRIVKTKHIESMSKKMAYDISQMGCKKINVNCLIPILDNDIELIIKNTNNDDKKTVISNKYNGNDNYRIFIKVDLDNFSHNKISQIFDDKSDEYEYIVIVGNIDGIIDKLQIIKKISKSYYINYYKYSENIIIIKLHDIDDDIMRNYYDSLSSI